MASYCIAASLDVIACSCNYPFLLFISWHRVDFLLRFYFFQIFIFILPIMVNFIDQGKSRQIYFSIVKAGNEKFHLFDPISQYLISYFFIIIIIIIIIIKTVYIYYLHKKIITKNITAESQY